MRTQRLRVTKRFDAHLHLRQKELMEDYVKRIGNRLAGILPMPNTKPPITTGEQALAYVEAIRAAGFEGAIVPTIKLTVQTKEKDLRHAKRLGVKAVKIYPQGLTTNSEDGMARHHLPRLDWAYAVMEEVGLHLLWHGEMPGETNLNREICFLAELGRIAAKFRKLKITMEHITTAQAAQVVSDLHRRYGNVMASITDHHLRVVLDDLLDGGLHMNDAYCKPIPKGPFDQQTLVAMVMSGNSAFYSGSDSAPHQKGEKEKDCGCAGVYTAPIGTELMVDLFERHGKLDRYTAFMFDRANTWFGLGLKPETIRLDRERWTVPGQYDGVVPFMAGKTLDWRVND